MVFKRWFEEQEHVIDCLSYLYLSKGKYADKAGLWLIKTTPDQG